MPRGNRLNTQSDLRYETLTSQLVADAGWYVASIAATQAAPPLPQPPPYDTGYYQGPPAPTLTGRVSSTYTYNPCAEEGVSKTIKEEVKVKVTAKDVTMCSACGSHNLTETPDPMVAKECLSCGSLMLVDGDVLQMAV